MKYKITKQPLTSEQQLFAEEHHNIVYSYLRFKRLKTDDFYDIVVFGFLRAVRYYLTHPELQQYAFTTIAFRTMEYELIDHYRAQSRHKRKANSYTVSLDTYVYNGESLPFSEVIPSPDSFEDDLEAAELWHEVASRLSKKQLDVLRMKVDGYDDSEIAEKHRTTCEGIENVMSCIRGRVCGMDLLCEHIH